MVIVLTFKRPQATTAKLFIPNIIIQNIIQDDFFFIISYKLKTTMIKMVGKKYNFFPKDVTCFNDFKNVSKKILKTLKYIVKMTA